MLSGVVTILTSLPQGPRLGAGGTLPNKVRGLEPGVDEEESGYVDSDTGEVFLPDGCEGPPVPPTPPHLLTWASPCGGPGNLLPCLVSGVCICVC